MRRKERDFRPYTWALAVILAVSVFVICVLLGSHGVPLIHQDSACMAIAQASRLSEGQILGAAPGPNPLPLPSNPLYVALITPIAVLTAYFGETFAFIGLTVLNALLLFTACKLAWDIAVMLMPPFFATMSMAAIFLGGGFAEMFFSLAGSGLSACLTLAVMRAWLLSLSDRSHRWWIPPIAWSTALSMCGPDGALLAMTGSAAAVMVHRRLGIVSRRTYQAMAIGLVVIPLFPIPYAVFGLPSNLVQIPPLSVNGVYSWSNASLGLLFEMVRTAWTGGVFPFTSFGFPVAALAPIVLAIAPSSIPRPATAMTGVFLLATLLFSSPGSPGSSSHLAALFALLLAFTGLWRLTEFGSERNMRRLAVTLAIAWLVLTTPFALSALASISHEASRGVLLRRIWRSVDSKTESGCVVTDTPGTWQFLTRGKPFRILAVECRPAHNAAPSRLFPLLEELKAGNPPCSPSLVLVSSVPLMAESARLSATGLFRTICSSGRAGESPAAALYEIDTELLGPAPSIPNWHVVSELDVLSLRSERNHAYRISNPDPLHSPPPVYDFLADPMCRRKVADGGRDATGSQSFIMEAEAGKPLLLLMRVMSPFGCRLAVTFNDLPPSELPLTPADGRFQTLLAGEYEGETVEYRNRIWLVTVPSPGDGYRSYHFWVLQPDTADEKKAPSSRGRGKKRD